MPYFLGSTPYSVSPVLFPVTLLTNYYKLSDLQQQEIILSISRDQKSESRSYITPSGKHHICTTPCKSNHLSVCSWIASTL